jgi:myosin heavy subunit
MQRCGWREGVRADSAMQKKVVETTLSAIQTGNDANLPPLMNPAMLEASDDLTNLSHLNEPAGAHTHT